MSCAVRPPDVMTQLISFQIRATAHLMFTSLCRGHRSVSRALNPRLYPDDAGFPLKYSGVLVLFLEK